MLQLFWTKIKAIFIPVILNKFDWMLCTIHLSYKLILLVFDWEKSVIRSLLRSLDSNTQYFEVYKEI